MAGDVQTGLTFVTIPILLPDGSENFVPLKLQGVVLPNGNLALAAVVVDTDGNSLKNLELINMFFKNEIEPATPYQG